MIELTVQEYMEMVGAEGLLTKSMTGDMLLHDTVGSNVPQPNIDNGDPNDEDENEDDEDEEDENEKEEGYTATLTIVTCDIDRLRDILNPMGCETKDFARNPLFLWEHGKQRPLADSLLGQIKSITMDEKGISAVARYMPHDPFSHKIMELERKGMIPGNSIGWRPLSGIKVDAQGNRHIDKWELLETSKVVLPANGKATNLRLSKSV